MIKLIGRHFALNNLFKAQRFRFCENSTEVSVEQFAQIDLRVGEIIDCQIVINLLNSASRVRQTIL